MKYIIACIVGALIGYITNWLAIKMLFRPYNEKRIFGIKMPFTPGLIPKEQKRIAKTIGETISKHLLSKETLTNELCSDKIHTHIEKMIHNKIDSLSKSKLKLNDVLLPLKEMILEKSDGLEKNISINQMIKDFLIRKKGELKISDITLTELIGSESLYGIKNYVNKNKESISLNILKVIKDPYMENKIKSAIASGIAANVNPLMAMFVNSESIYEKVMAYIEVSIHKIEVQEEIVLTINKLIDSIGNRKVKNILDEIDQNEEEKIIGILSNKISKHLLCKESVEIIIEKIFEIKISTFINGNKDKLITITTNIIIDSYSKFINKNGEDILELLNIEKLIENQINSFDVQFAEKLIIDIANKELKAITWLGALLGGIMGILSPIISSLY